MEKERPKVLFVTANVGSLFEEFGDVLKKNWINEFRKLLNLHQPVFVGLHLQEIGGKTQCVDENDLSAFFKEICDLEVFTRFSCIKSYVDDDYDEDTYTALGCCYFVHDLYLSQVKLWNFKDASFESVTGKTLIRNNKEIRKFKFPLACFSKHLKRWPRKGFTWSRWWLNKRVIDLLNIHLSHDACNITAAMKSTTKYSKYRKRALDFTLEQLHTLPLSHSVLFGDFNVRPDTKALVAYIMKDRGRQVVLNAESNAVRKVKPDKLIYESINGSIQTLLTIEGRSFNLRSYDSFSRDHVPDLLEFDRELNWLKDCSYKEVPVSFLPTYPHNENPHGFHNSTFANVRCPSWCDRVIMDTDFHDRHVNLNTVYDSIGDSVYLGDHKPVFLLVDCPFDEPINK